MNTIFNMTSIEIKNILTEKGIQHEYVIGDYGFIWIGVITNTQLNWISFINENSIGFLNAETYSNTTNKTAKGFETRLKVINRFEKMINK
jgi:hypothetical protein